MAKTGRGSEAFMLRLPDGLRDRIRAAAERAFEVLRRYLARVDRPSG